MIPKSIIQQYKKGMKSMRVPIEDWLVFEKWLAPTVTDNREAKNKMINTKLFYKHCEILPVGIDPKFRTI